MLANVQIKSILLKNQPVDKFIRLVLYLLFAIACLLLRICVKVFIAYGDAGLSVLGEQLHPNTDLLRSLSFFTVYLTEGTSIFLAHRGSL